MDIALILSGGGAKGAFEAGVLRAVRAAGLAPRIVAGTSAGALNAAAYAVGMDQQVLESLWGRIRPADVYRVRRDLHRLLRPWRLIGRGALAGRLLDAIGWTWLFHTDPLRRTLVTALGGEQVVAVDDRVLTVVAAEQLSGAPARFTNRPPPPHRADPRFRVVDITVDHLMASAALPVVFEPAPVDGVRYWDGGLVANTPVGAALAYEPDAAIVVLTGQLDQPSHPPADLGDALALLFDHVMEASLRRACASAMTTNTLVEHAPEATVKRRVELLLIDPGPHPAGAGSLLDFDPARSRALIELGYKVATRELEGFLDRLPG